MNINSVKETVAASLAAAGIEVPSEFPCPVDQHITEDQPLASYIDHTLLKQTAGEADYHKLFAEAREWKPFSCCIPPGRVPQAVRELEGSGVKTCTVVGFPWGYDSTAAKVADTKWSVAEGCDEIDMVVQVGLLKDANYAAVFRDIAAVVEAADGHLVKVILETAELTEEEIAAASWISGWAGAWFVKTSTGFASAGASVEAVKIMRSIAGDKLGVKASGGIRNAEFTQELIAAGADRIGASATGAIISGSNASGSGY